MGATNHRCNSTGNKPTFFSWRYEESMFLSESSSLLLSPFSCWCFGFEVDGLARDEDEAGTRDALKSRWRGEGGLSLQLGIWWWWGGGAGPSSPSPPPSELSALRAWKRMRSWLPSRFASFVCFISSDCCLSPLMGWNTHLYIYCMFWVCLNLKTKWYI